MDGNASLTICMSAGAGLRASLYLRQFGGSFVKTAFALLLSSAALCLAQESKTENVKRLVSVTWDLATHRLIWMVEKGTVVDGEFVPSTKI